MALKTQNNGFLATSGGGDSVSQRQRRFADARGTEEQDIGPTIEATAEHSVQCGSTAPDVTGQNGLQCPDAITRGNISSPPRRMSKSWARS
jgi:hypothetical protein